MHKIKSDGSYIDKRSRDVAGMIEARRATAAAEAGTEEIHLDMPQLYMDIVGQKKQRVYGLGRKLPSSQTASSSTTSINELERIRSEAQDEGRAEARAELLQQMEEMRLKQQQIEEEMRQKQQQMAEEMRKKQEEIEGQLRIVMQRIGQGSHALPSPSAPTDDVDPIDGGEDLGQD